MKSLIFLLVTSITLLSCGVDGVNSVVTPSKGIIGTLDWESVVHLPEGSKERINSKAVGNLVISGVGDNCTAFLISENVIMTNQHCIGDAKEAMGVRFNLGKDENPIKGHNYFCSTFIGNNEDLDYALLRCLGNPGKKFGFVKLEGDVHLNSPIYVVQQNCDQRINSSCDPYKLISEGTLSEGYMGFDFLHDADTLVGSSGSPVFSKYNHSVIALHNTGYKGVANRASYNGAIKMSKILRDIRTRFGNILPKAISNRGLFIAAQNGDLKRIKYLIQSREDINAVDDLGVSAFMHAAFNGHFEVMKYLLRIGADINAKTKTGLPLLNWMAAHGKLNVVRFLLQNGAKINVSSEVGRTALMEASVDGDLEMVRFFLSKSNIDVNKADYSGITSLMVASQLGNGEVVKELLDHFEIDVNRGDKRGYAPLLKASVEGRSEIVKLLLGHPDIDVNKANKNGMNALMVASFEGHTKIVRELLAHRKIDVNQADSRGYASLFWATEEGKDQIVKLLLGHPDINVNKKFGPGVTPLRMAKKFGRTKIARMLKAAGGRM